MSDDFDFRTVRVLIVAGKQHVVRTLRTALNLLGVNQIVTANDAGGGLLQLKLGMFQAVICDEYVGKIGGQTFAVAARRDREVLNQMIPIFLTCASTRRRVVEAARDEGITDVLSRPLSAATVGRKLSQSLNRPRSFIVATDFFGPDRRGKDRAAFKGQDRRVRQPRKVKIPKPGDDTVQV